MSSKEGQISYEVLNDYHTISKSRSLVLLDEYAVYGTAQYILLDMYLSQINPQNTDNTMVKFPKKDYEKYKEIKRVKPEPLSEELQKLMIAVKIPDPYDEKAFRIKPLFKECKVEKEEDGEYWITMKCEKEMQDLFFNVNKIGYIKYRLGMMKEMDLPTRLLYNELHLKKYIKPYFIELDRLKKLMKLTSKAYSATFEFMRKFRASVDLINEKTNLIVTYEKRNNSNHELIGIDFVITLDENKIDEDLSMYIAELLDIKYEEAEPITKIAQKNNLSEESIRERINYVLSKSNVENKIAYTVSLFKNEELWKKITEKKNSPVTSGKKDSARDWAQIEREKLAWQDERDRKIWREEHPGEPLPDYLR